MKVDRQNILVIGAGVIGTLYAAKLAARGHAVTLLARGERYAKLVEHGVMIREEHSEAIEQISLTYITEVDESIWYDYCFVAVRYDQLEQLKPVLDKLRCKNLVSMVNSPEGLGAFDSLHNSATLLCAFPGAGGRRNGQCIVYHILSPLIQSTAVGCRDRTKTIEVRRCADILKDAGFPVAIYDEIDSYLISHVALIAPLCFYVYAIDACIPAAAARRLAADSLKEGLRSISTGKSVLLPKRLGILRHVPRCLLAGILWMLTSTKFFETVIASHARYATVEMRQLCQSFYSRENGKFSYVLHTFNKGLNLIRMEAEDGVL